MPQPRPLSITPLHKAKIKTYNDEELNPIDSLHSNSSYHSKNNVRKYILGTLITKHVSLFNNKILSVRNSVAPNPNYVAATK